jgi:hypothetical protein
MIWATHTRRERYGRPALYNPSEDLRERGDYRGIVRPSLYTALRLRPAAMALGAAGAAVLFSLTAARASGLARPRSTPPPSR